MPLLLPRVQNPYGYPKFRGRDFWSQNNNKYKMIPITTSTPKPGQDIRSGFRPKPNDLLTKKTLPRVSRQ